MPGSPTESEDAGSVAVPAPDYLWFVDLALREMARIVGELGDELANRRPPFRGGNSPFVILTHCLGVLEYWGGATVAQRPVQRDRAAEFTRAGRWPTCCDGPNTPAGGCARTSSVSTRAPNR